MYGAPEGQHRRDTGKYSGGRSCRDPTPSLASSLTRLLFSESHSPALATQIPANMNGRLTSHRERLISQEKELAKLKEELRG